MKIALMCPTRNRLNKVLTLISSLATTIKDKNTELILGVDMDDPILQVYSNLEFNIPFVKVVRFENNNTFLGLSKMWNTMYQEIDADIYAMIGDDMIFYTEGWDAKIIEIFNNAPKDKIIMVHCNDGMRGPGNKYESVPPLCVNFFVHKNYTKALNRFVQPYEPNTHHDTWVQIVFNTLKRVIYRHDILIKHLHYTEYNTGMDEISQNIEKLRENIWNNDNFIRNNKLQLDEEVQILSNLITHL